MTKFLAFLLAFSLTACGYKGPLTLPAGPAPEPLLGNPKPTPAKQPTPVETRTPKAGTDQNTSAQ